VIILLKKFAQIYRAVFPEFFLFLLNLPLPLRTPVALKLKLCQNISYLKLSGKNNCFHPVTTIFAQQLNICSPKLGNQGSFQPHLAKHLAAVTDGYVDLILLRQLQTRKQLTLVTKRHLWQCLAYWPWLFDHSACIT